MHTIGLQSQAFGGFRLLQKRWQEGTYENGCQNSSYEMDSKIFVTCIGNKEMEKPGVWFHEDLWSTNADTVYTADTVPDGYVYKCDRSSESTCGFYIDFLFGLEKDQSTTTSCVDDDAAAKALCNSAGSDTDGWVCDCADLVSKGLCDDNDYGTAVKAACPKACGETCSVPEQDNGTTNPKSCARRMRGMRTVAVVAAAGTAMLTCT